MYIYIYIQTKMIIVVIRYFPIHFIVREGLSLIKIGILMSQGLAVWVIKLNNTRNSPSDL